MGARGSARNVRPVYETQGAGGTLRMSLVVGRCASTCCGAGKYQRARPGVGSVPPMTCDRRRTRPAASGAESDYLETALETANGGALADRILVGKGRVGARL